MTAPPPYGRSPRVPGPREVAQTYFLVGNNNQHPHLLYTLLLPTRTGNGDSNKEPFNGLGVSGEWRLMRPKPMLFTAHFSRGHSMVEVWSSGDCS